MHMGALSSCLSVHQYVYLVPSDDIRSPGTELQIVGCKPPCGHWEQNMGPLEKPVLLNTEPSCG